jgi:hypothetical protein
LGRSGGELAAAHDRDQRAHVGPPPDIEITPAHAAYGAPTWETVDDVVAAAFDELIVPGFAHVGIAVTR